MGPTITDPSAVSHPPTSNSPRHASHPPRARLAGIEHRNSRSPIRCTLTRTPPWTAAAWASTRRRIDRGRGRKRRRRGTPAPSPPPSSSSPSSAPPPPPPPLVNCAGRSAGSTHSLVGRNRTFTGKTYLVGRIAVVKPGAGITRGCVRRTRIKGQGWNASGACKICSRRREVNVGIIGLGTAIIQAIISIVKEMTGIGMQKHFMLIKEQISDRCPGKL